MYKSVQKIFKKYVFEQGMNVAKLWKKKHIYFGRTPLVSMKRVHPLPEYI